MLLLLRSLIPSPTQVRRHLPGGSETESLGRVRATVKCVRNRRQLIPAQLVGAGAGTVVAPSSRYPFQTIRNLEIMHA